MKLSVRRLAASAALTLGLTAGAAMAAAPAYAYGPNSGTVTVNNTIVAPGAGVIFAGNFNCANCTVNIYIHSVGLFLGTTTTNAQGLFSTTVTVPSNFSGNHELIAVASDGESASTAILVSSTSSAPPAAVPPSSGLPFTGADVGASVGVAAVAIGIGGGLVLMSRKRRQADELVSR